MWRREGCWPDCVARSGESGRPASPGNINISQLSCLYYHINLTLALLSCCKYCCILHASLSGVSESLSAIMSETHWEPRTTERSRLPALLQTASAPPAARPMRRAGLRGASNGRHPGNILTERWGRKQQLQVSRDSTSVSKEIKCKDIQEFIDNVEGTLSLN